MARLHVRVTPKSFADAVLGVEEGELRVRVKAAPTDGKANTAACSTVAAFLGVPKTCVALVSGGSSRHKVLEVKGLSAVELSRLLNERKPEA